MAPSPTGHLHFGTARTTLFNWLFARHAHGCFVMRIEDTDRERSRPEYEKEILEGLHWLGVNWDEGPDVGGEYEPYRQSERGEIYADYLKKLLDSGAAYYCYCTKEELEAERQAMLAAGLSPRYQGRCRVHPPTDRPPQVIRFAVPEATLEFKDQIRGKIAFDMALVGDIVIAKDLQNPLYNFAVVVDDAFMEISHVIRGEEHLANTPKQILIQKALGFRTPEYAHLPLILNQDRSKLSKRYVETSLLSYRDLGYLPEALLNFMALLGWHPKDTPEGSREVFTPEELVREFDLKRVQKAGAVFSEEKLAWLNSQHIRLLPKEELAKRIREFARGRWQELDEVTAEKIVELARDRAATLKDFLKEAEVFYGAKEYAPALLSWKEAGLEGARKNLHEVRELIAALSGKEVTRKQAEDLIMPLAEREGRGAVLWPLRVALSGERNSPGPFELMSFLGKEKSLERIDAALSKLSS